MASIIAPLLTIHNQIKVFHWQTRSFSEHKALDGAYESLEESIDEFVETYQGIFGRIFAQDSFLIELKNHEHSQTSPMGMEDCPMSNVPSTVNSWISYLKGLDQDEQINKHTDLLNIRDEMLGALNQLQYLLTLC